MLWAGAWQRCWPELNCVNLPQPTYSAWESFQVFPVAELPITSPSPAEFSAEGTLKPGLAMWLKDVKGMYQDVLGCAKTS